MTGFKCESAEFNGPVCRRQCSRCAAPNSGNEKATTVNHDLLQACKRAADWLSGWASAEPYLSDLNAAIAAAEIVRPSALIATARGGVE